jgi:hypothetical protein
MGVVSEQKAISIGYHDVDDREHSESYFLSPKTALHYKLSRSEFHDHLQSIRSEAPANPLSTINGLRRGRLNKNESDGSLPGPAAGA